MGIIYLTKNILTWVEICPTQVRVLSQFTTLFTAQIGDGTFGWEKNGNGVKFRQIYNR